MRKPTNRQQFSTEHAQSGSLPALWRTATIDHEVAARFADELQVPLRVARWLCARARDEEEARNWLSSPDTASPLPWQLFHGMTEAVRLVLQAVQDGTRVCIVGDYDVDGVTASTIFATCLDALGADWFCLIPHRVDDGYGLSRRLVEKARAGGAQLIATVDNGIRANDAVLDAAEHGIDVVITDHHEPGEDIPGLARAVVHWLASDDTRAVQVLSGAGVARKLADALCDTLRERGETEASERIASLFPWLDGLAALGALADVMPMRGENRRLVRVGVKSLRTATMPGWTAVCQIAGVDPGKATEQTLLWNITPRLNAAGRMGDAMVAFDCLMARDVDTAEAAASQIEVWNRARREATDRAAREATAACVERFGDETPPAIVVRGPWPLGVVGIVAARLCDEYQRPAIVLADDGSRLLRGSGRAPAGFPLLETVELCSAHLAHYGGHEAAIGCGVAREELDHFRSVFERHAEVRLVENSDVDAVGTVVAVADDYLPLSEVTLDTWSWLDRLGPFGTDNEPLLFYLGPLEVVRMRSMGGRGQHLRIDVREAATTAQLVWFSADDAAKAWEPGRRIGALVHLEENVWQGTRNVQARVVAAQSLPDTVIDRDVFSDVYRLLRARRRLHVEEAFGTRVLAIDKLHLIFDTFVELGFARREESAYHMIDGATPRDLRESPSYQQHLARAWSNA